MVVIVVMVVMMAKMMMVMVVKVFMRSILGLATLPGGGTGWQGPGGADANKVFIATFDIEANPPFIQFTFQALILFPCKIREIVSATPNQIFLLILSVLTVLYFLVSSSSAVSGFKSHCAGRHFRTKLMSRYIGSGQKKRFDVGIQELVSKVQKRTLLRKDVL